MLSVDQVDVERAKIIVHGHQDLSGRHPPGDHGARGSGWIMSFDPGFDTFPGVTRLSG